jgi:hypothetical protein
MSKGAKLPVLLNQILDLPEAAQSELLEPLLDVHAQPLGVYQLDDDDRAALARSDEDVRLGRFASDAAIDAMYGRYRGS